jgi:uracil-DNA glycosylase
MGIRKTATVSARDFLPEKCTLKTLRRAAKSCKGCDLHKNATQTVFGEGPEGANVMFVGEQPGDQEDRQGRPFVGPAGRLLDEAMIEARIPREQVYVTNAVDMARQTTSSSEARDQTSDSVSALAGS